MNDERPSIEREWQGYAERLFRGMSPGTVQYEETKKAFYAGFWVAFMIVRQISNHPEDQAVEMLEAIEKETQGTVEAFLEQKVREWNERKGGLTQ